MKIFRRILVAAALLAVLAGLLAGLAFLPAVQTWYAQSKLDARDDVHGTVGSLSAGLHQVELADVHLEIGAMVVDIPALQATLPVADAAWKHDYRVRRLVAKGWTIDLSRTLEPAKPGPVPAAGATPPAAPAELSGAQQALGILQRIAAGRELPGDVALDEVELEGDVIVFTPRSGSVRVHVRITGGGVAPGREGDLAVEADAVSPWPGVREAAAHGHLRVASAASRRLDRVALQADVVVSREAAGDLNLALDAALARGDGETVYRVGLGQGGHRKLAVVAHCPDAQLGVHGEWEVNATHADLALLFPETTGPDFAAVAGGKFTADAGLARLRLEGKIAARAGRLETIAPALGRLGEVGLAVNFQAERGDGLLRFAAADATVTRGATLVSVQSRQPFTLDEQTGALAVADAKRDWLEGVAQRLPLEWLADPGARLAVTGDDVSGEFLVQSDGGLLALRPTRAWNTGGVAVRLGGRLLAEQLDVSLAWRAEHDAAGWRLAWAPLTLSRAGRRLATVEAKFARPPGENRTTTATGTWNADLEAVAALPEFSAFGRLGARTATGDFTAGLAALSQVDARVTVAGRDPGHGLTASVTAAEEGRGKWSFQIPLKLTAGLRETELTAEGSWMSDPENGRSYFRVTGEKAVAEDLARLAAPWAALAGVAWPADLVKPAAGTTARDAAPFWGRVEGTLVFEFGRLGVGDRVYRNVGGSLEVDGREVRAEHLRGQLERARPAEFQGRLTFDPAAERPYALQASGDLGELDLATLLPPPKHGEDPLLEGHCTVTGGLSGTGANLADLAARTQQEFKLTSKGGISRLLKVYIGDVFQDEDSSALSDTVGGVGSLFGKLLALKHEVREKKVSPAVDNVLDLSSVLAEVELDACALTVVREPDGGIRLAAIELTAPELRLTGSGAIAGGTGPDYFSRPLRLDLTLGVRGHTAEMADKAGLLAKAKDAAGFANLGPALHFGGSLAKLDQAQWHDLLVKAMNLPPAKNAAPAVSARP